MIIYDYDILSTDTWQCTGLPARAEPLKQDLAERPPSPRCAELRFEKKGTEIYSDGIVIVTIIVVVIVIVVFIVIVLVIVVAIVIILVIVVVIVIVLVIVAVLFQVLSPQKWNLNNILRTSSDKSLKSIILGMFFLMM